MFMQKLSVFSILLIILSSGTALASSSNLERGNISQNEIQLAQNRPQNRPGRGQRGGNLADELNLTEDQQQQIQAIRQEYRSQIQQKREMVRTLRQELNDLYVSTASAEQLRDKQQELSQLREEINNLNFESFIEIREILSLEQRQQFRDFMEQRGNDRPGRSGRDR
ncbi:MAG: Spy/CpxP family protein refolding chaperone [Spirulina sp.]